MYLNVTMNFVECDLLRFLDVTLSIMCVFICVGFCGGLYMYRGNKMSMDGSFERNCSRHL